ncbi:MAG: hypothetical protein ACP6KW_10975 [Candidatus Thorarchaeota archaeon]
MSDRDARLIGIFREQLEVEKQALERVSRMEDESSETAVRLAFMDLRLDTWKHVKFLEGMIELLSTTPCDEWSAKVARYAGRVKLERQVQELAASERQMMELMDKALDLVDDPIARLLIEHMRGEEGSHHEDLGRLVDLIKQAPLQSKKGKTGSEIVCD